MERKGISQVLFLIIAASVLMMVALTLIFMFQSGAGDTNQQAQAQSCRASVQAKCNNIGGESVTAPSSCYSNVGGTIEPTTSYNVYASYSSGTFSTTNFAASEYDTPYYMDCGVITE